MAPSALAQDRLEAEGDIIVTAQRANQTEVTAGGSVGILGDKKAEDVPFTIKSYNSALILNQQPQTLGQVLENDPSVRTTYGFGNAAEQFIVRGFTLFSDDLGINGLYGLSPRQLIVPELFESVQVLNGASAFLNGAAPGGSGLGGSVNLVAKRAGPKDLTRVTAGYTADEHVGGSFDVSRRSGDFGVRINGVGRSGDLATDGEFRRTYAIGGALDYDSGPVRLSLDLGYQDIKIRGLRPKVTGATFLPVVPDADANYAQPWTYTRLRDIFAVAKAEYDVADNAMIYINGGVKKGDEDGLYAGFGLTNTATGDAFYSPSIIPYEARGASTTAGIRVKLEAGGITHEVNAGGTMIWQSSRSAYRFLAGDVTNLYDNASLAYPTVPTFVGGDLDDPTTIGRAYTGSVFVSDTFGFWEDRILLTAGVRLQTITQKSYDYNTTQLTNRYAESATTPAFGLVVKPVAGLSLYANYIEGFEPGSQAAASVSDPSLPDGIRTVTNAGEFLPPTKTEQIEIGGKVAVGRLTGSLAVFQIDRPLPAYIVDSPTTAVYGTFGQQRNRGIEFNVEGEVVSGLRVIAGGTVIDAKLRRTNQGINQGNTAQGVPDYLLNGNVEWDLPFFKGATLTGRVVNTGKQKADDANSYSLPSWTRVDLGARYVLLAADKPITLRFGVDNVANERYWASSFDRFGVGLLQGAPRTYKASVSVDL
ncbi:MAG: TonB-dependent siderophore receptor [Sphingobium sp.]